MNLEIEQFQPVRQLPIADQTAGVGRHPGAGHQAPQAPESAAHEAQHDQVAVRTEHAVHLAQNLGLALRIVERVR